MGFYLDLSCRDRTCRFHARIGDATEFYVDASGQEMEYGHPICHDPEAAHRGIAGYWRDLLCWNCGRQDRDSVKLHMPIRDPAMAWAVFPPPDMRARPCPDCKQILWDVDGLRMLLEYRAAPEAVRAAVQKDLAARKEPVTDPVDDALLRNEEFGEEIAEMWGRSGDAVRRLEAEAAAIRDILTPEEMLLHRLGLPPHLPVQEASVAALRAGITTAVVECEELRKEMLARFEEQRVAAPAPASGRARDGFLKWYRSPAMKTKRRLDARMGEARTLTMHWYFAALLLRDPERTLEMFRHRCPRCKADGLDVQQYHT
jgi:hypothetical protein